MRSPGPVARALFAFALSGVPAGLRAGQDRSLVVFEAAGANVTVPARFPSRPLPLGSLTKPFVAHAWAEAHPRQASPVRRCDASSHCWKPSGHGTVGLVRAVAVSCNAYFRALAAETPRETLVAVLRSAGFRTPEPLTPETAIGLAGEAGTVSAPPEAVLRAYAALVREPWAGGEAVRREVLAGLRDSAHDGTATGLAGLGLLAKTGTVPAVDGRALATSGWAVAVDETGHGLLALLTPGTGREAARALARRLRRGDGDGPADAGQPMVPRDGRVRVALFGALAPRRVLARNLGAAPLAAREGFVGAGATVELRPGDRLADGVWELSVPAHGLRRILRGTVEVAAGVKDVLRVRAEIEPREYVAGVVAGELSAQDDARRVPLGAAVLRFLAAGPRHGESDVCDLTHCAFFVGRGPRVAWPSPRRALLLERPGDDARGTIDDTTWHAMVASAREPGPDRWTSHCGGEPLSTRRVWGGDDTRVFRCDRHGPGDTAAWQRRWTRRDADRAFGGQVLALRVGERDGRWRLEVTKADGPLALSWDEAHARLAAVLGWGALPSPADRVVRERDGFRAEGRGLGHRVGLCLGAAPALLD